MIDNHEQECLVPGCHEARGHAFVDYVGGQLVHTGVVHLPPDREWLEVAQHPSSGCPVERDRRSGKTPAWFGWFCVAFLLTTGGVILLSATQVASGALALILALLGGPLFALGLLGLWVETGDEIHMRRYHR